MSWARFDDRYHDNRKIKRAWRRHPRAVGLHAMAVTYCSMHETDGLVDAEWLEDKLPAKGERQKCIAALVDVGLFEPAGTLDDYLVHDYLDFNSSKEQREAERAEGRWRSELSKDKELVAAIRSRDNGRCRYCGAMVNWKDRRGAAGGTYDHVIPRGPNSLENVVVACRGCNSQKRGRTPEEAQMPLLEPGSMGPGRISHRFDSGASSDLEPDLTTRPAPPQTRPAHISSSVATAEEEDRPEVIGLCHLLADLIRQNNPKAKVAPESKGWRDAMRLLIDRDDRDEDEIELVIRWCQADDFWRTNILSAPKLREQFDKLWLRMQPGNGAGTGHRSNGPTAQDFLALRGQQ